MKTSELTGPALDWAVATANSSGLILPSWFLGSDYALKYSTDWAQGGPIIEREKISVIHMEGTQHWVARKFQPACDTTPKSEGPTPLIAAMRCFVASKLGDEVDVPEELI